jgi:hypothetical protein
MTGRCDSRMGAEGLSRLHMRKMSWDGGTPFEAEAVQGFKELVAGAVRGPEDRVTARDTT